MAFVPSLEQNENDASDTKMKEQDENDGSDTKMKIVLVHQLLTKRGKRQKD